MFSSLHCLGYFLYYWSPSVAMKEFSNMLILLLQNLFLVPLWLLFSSDFIHTDKVYVSFLLFLCYFYASVLFQFTHTYSEECCCSCNMLWIDLAPYMWSSERFIYSPMQSSYPSIKFIICNNVLLIAVPLLLIYGHQINSYILQCNQDLDK